MKHHEHGDARYAGETSSGNVIEISGVVAA